VVIAPDLNPLQISWEVKDSQGRVFMSGGSNSNETVYCGVPGEALLATFYDSDGDGACFMGGLPLVDEGVRAANVSLCHSGQGVVCS
jgi:hypothetical protein